MRIPSLVFPGSSLEIELEEVEVEVVLGEGSVHQVKQ